MGNIHGISCTANNYLKQAWNDIKNEYEKNKTYSITLFENTLVCFMRLYKEIRRQQAEDYIPCLECDSLEKEFIDSCLNDKKCILHLPEFIFNDNKARLVLDTDPEKRINEVKNFLTALSDSICSLFIVNSNVASISLGNESFSTDEDLEYGYLINTGNHYDVYLPPELFAQAYELNNKERNAQIGFLTRYAI
ncbi:hypothetical protein S11_1464 [Escherichia coli B26-1]|uniref:hypothetical protein n=1 Tax=Escherichia coli TaxID=562 RepID=UPI00039126D9|nr:hypothetical protein S11_1464 [Escherichia coli B26-1]ERB98084.1 hypothetical protein S13_1376 [Escherichia coli B26-2]MBE8151379.1 hypothetical protein [Escherichia coli]